MERVEREPLTPRTAQRVDAAWQQWELDTAAAIANAPDAAAEQFRAQVAIYVNI